MGSIFAWESLQLGATNPTKKRASLDAGVPAPIVSALLLLNYQVCYFVPRQHNTRRGRMEIQIAQR